MSRLLRVVRYVFLLLLVVTSTVAMTLVFFLHGSLPKLDGTLIVPGLRAKVEIERDSQGIPTLSAIHREDIAYGLGFLHAQERFFQMDLYRRKAAGESAELLGSDALIADRTARRHNFRNVAQGALANTSMERRRALDAYTLGVNQGLAQLRQPPMEYLLLGEEPAPWRAEDSFLVLLHQHQLLYGDPTADLLNRHYLAAELPTDWQNFLNTGSNAWRAPGLDRGPALAGLDDLSPTPLPTTPLPTLLAETEPAVAARPGQPQPRGHQWAVSSALTATDSALLASDLLLPRALPNHWFRAQWRLPGSTRLVSGITLPGAPMLFMGSNGHLAWTLAPTGDHGARLKRLEVEGNRYRTPDGWRTFTERRERIAVQGTTTQELVVRDTQWGPVVGRDSSGHWLALHWDAHEPAALNMNLMALETAASVDTALTDHPLGTPAQHLFVADRAGRIGWSQIGVRARGNRTPDPALITEWQPMEALPTPGVPLLDQTRLWRADSAGVQASAGTGNGLASGVSAELSAGAAAVTATGYGRMEQLRSALHAQTRFHEQDMRGLQLATDAHRLQPWLVHLRARLLPVDPTDAGAAARSRLSAVLTAAEDPQTPLESPAYVLAQVYQNALNARTLGPLLQSVQARQRQFQPPQTNTDLDGPLWRLVHQADARHLPTAFDSWSALFDEAAAVATAEFAEPAPPRIRAALNPIIFQHPLTDRVPGLDRLTNWLAATVTGEAQPVRLQHPGQRAAMGLVVSPGAEHRAELHLPGSQSNHPFIPYFWRVHGDGTGQGPSPLLPDITRYQMTLLPQR